MTKDEAVTHDPLDEMISELGRISEKYQRERNALLDKYFPVKEDVRLVVVDQG